MNPKPTILIKAAMFRNWTIYFSLTTLNDVSSTILKTFNDALKIWTKEGTVD